MVVRLSIVGERELLVLVYYTTYIVRPPVTLHPVHNYVTYCPHSVEGLVSSLEEDRGC
jgi:hypothetical protein